MQNCPFWQCRILSAFFLLKCPHLQMFRWSSFNLFKRQMFCPKPMEQAWKGLEQQQCQHALAGQCKHVTAGLPWASIGLALDQSEQQWMDGANFYTADQAAQMAETAKMKIEGVNQAVTACRSNGHIAQHHQHQQGSSGSSSRSGSSNNGYYNN